LRRPEIDVQRGQLTDSQRFAEELSERLQRRIELLPGRPKKPASNNGAISRTSS